MSAHLRQVTAAQLARYLEGPGVFYRQFRPRDVPSGPPSSSCDHAAPAARSDIDEIDLQASWHCLNIILTGGTRLAGRAIKHSPIVGGRAIPDRRKVMAHGPVRYFTAEEVAVTVSTLAAFPWLDHIAGHDCAAAGCADVDSPQRDGPTLDQHCERLIRLYQDASRRGNAILTWLE